MERFSILVNGKTYTGHFTEPGKVGQMFGNGQQMKLGGKLAKSVMQALSNTLGRKVEAA